MTVKKTLAAKKKVAATPVAVASKGKSLEEFRSAHDKNYIVPKKIKEALAKLGDSWEYEVDFLKLASLSTTDLAQYKDQFEAYIVPVKVSGGSHKKNVWAGTPAFAAKLRELAS
jgi:hypothetical protein